MSDGAFSGGDEMTFDQCRQVTQDHRRFVQEALMITCAALVLLGAVGGLTYGCHRSTELDKHMAMVGYYDGDEWPGMVHWRPIKRLELSSFDRKQAELMEKTREGMKQ